MCYVKCQNILVNVLVHLYSSTLLFWLRCPSVLLSKFAIQLKLIPSVVWVGILRICITSSTFRVLQSGFWVLGLKFPSLRDLFQFQFQGPGCQGPRIPGPRVTDLRILGLRVLGSRISGLRVPGPDFRLCLGLWLCFKGALFKFTKRGKRGYAS